MRYFLFIVYIHTSTKYYIYIASILYEVMPYCICIFAKIASQLFVFSSFKTVKCYLIWHTWKEFTCMLRLCFCKLSVLL